MKEVLIFIIFTIVLIIAIKGKKKPPATAEKNETKHMDAGVEPMIAIEQSQPEKSPVSPAQVAAVTAVISLLTGRKPSEFICTAIRPLGQAPAFSAWTVLGTSEIINTRQQYFERKGK